jgi:hypothetical protein
VWVLPLLLAASSRENSWMTGFKVHCAPGFVDRAYLVFLVADITHRTADYDGSESLSPPLPVRVVGPGIAAGVRAPGAECVRKAGFNQTHEGENLGRPWRQRWECDIVSPTARSFRPRPPGGACPFTAAGLIRPVTRIRGLSIADRMPVSGRRHADLTSQAQPAGDPVLAAMLGSCPDREPGGSWRRCHLAG